MVLHSIKAGRRRTPVLLPSSLSEDHHHQGVAGSAAVCPGAAVRKNHRQTVQVCLAPNGVCNNGRKAHAQAGRCAAGRKMQKGAMHSGGLQAGGDQQRWCAGRSVCLRTGKAVPTEKKPRHFIVGRHHVVRTIIGGGGMHKKKAGRLSHPPEDLGPPRRQVCGLGMQAGWGTGTQQVQVEGITEEGVVVQ